MATITRLADSGDKAGRASHIALVDGPGNFAALTGVRTAEGQLRLIQWDLSENDVRRGIEGRFAGDITDVAMLSSPGPLVTALRANGNLKVVAWAADLQPIGDSGTQAGEAMPDHDRYFPA
jgi:hypothetical protein